MTNEYRLFVGIPEGRKLLKRPRRSLKNNIKMALVKKTCNM
jgi:hypothetical protein